MANFTDTSKHPTDLLPLTKSSEVGSRLEKEELHRLWCLYLGWRTAVSGNGLRKLSSNEATSIAEIEVAVKQLIAPHWPSAAHVSFLLALMCSAADTASRFSRAQIQEDQIYLEMAFEMFWNGVATVGPRCWARSDPCGSSAVSTKPSQAIVIVFHWSMTSAKHLDLCREWWFGLPSSIARGCYKASAALITLDPSSYPGKTTICCHVLPVQDQGV